MLFLVRAPSEAITCSDVSNDVMVGTYAATKWFTASGQTEDATSEQIGWKFALVYFAAGVRSMIDRPTTDYYLRETGRLVPNHWLP